jgi:hypothetical protein
VDDRGAQLRRLSRFRELKFTYVGVCSPSNPKDKTTVSPAMLITTSRVALSPTSSAKLANSAGLSMTPPPMYSTAASAMSTRRRDRNRGAWIAKASRRDKSAPKKLKANTPLRTVALIAGIASMYCSSERSASPSVTEQA